MEKKCFVFSLLCPVYGLGALSILFCTGKMAEHPLAVFFVGALTAAAVEYVVGFLYQNIFGFRIWNYSKMPFNIQGHVCLLFTFFWGLLSLLLVYVVHPTIKQYTSMVSPRMCTVLLLLFILDAVFSTYILLKYHQKQALNLTWLLRHN